MGAAKRSGDLDQRALDPAGQMNPGKVFTAGWSD